jgi:D-amino peptidase
MKLYISADLEGIVGVVTGEQTNPPGFEYERFREFMTAEVNAAIEAAVEAGVKEVVVSDSHGNGQNLLIEKLPKDVTLVRSWPRPLSMMQGIDETFDAAIFIGYHSSAANLEGVLAHTISGSIADIQLQGVSMPEAGINAAIAGHFDVPVIMVSGDDAAVKEMTTLLGDIEGAVVKWAYEVIREKVKRAVGRIKEFKPYKLETPIRLDVRFKSYRRVEVLSYLPIVERIDPLCIRFTGRDMVEVSKFLVFLTNYETTM